MTQSPTWSPIASTVPSWVGAAAGVASWSATSSAAGSWFDAIDPNALLLSGDTSLVELSGDMNSGLDLLEISGDQRHG
jgi:hypothetical protein